MTNHIALDNLLLFRALVLCVNLVSKDDDFSLIVES